MRLRPTPVVGLLACFALLAGTAGASADTTAPRSRFDSRDGSVVFSMPEGSPVCSIGIPVGVPTSGCAVEGRSDDESSIPVIYLTLTNKANGSRTTTFIAPYLCTGGTCFWRLAVPRSPGAYTVRAQAADRAGNTESPGPEITIYVL